MRASRCFILLIFLWKKELLHSTHLYYDEFLKKCSVLLIFVHPSLFPIARTILAAHLYIRCSRYNFMIIGIFLTLKNFCLKF